MVKSQRGTGKQNRHLPAFLLLFLNNGDSHGGALWNRICELMPAQWEIDSGAVYRVLRDLEKRGCLISYWDTEDTGPAKRIYHITSSGLEELCMWYDDIKMRKQNLEFFLREYESSVDSVERNQEIDK